LGIELFQRRGISAPPERYNVRLAAEGMDVSRSIQTTKNEMGQTQRLVAVKDHRALLSRAESARLFQSLIST